MSRKPTVLMILDGYGLNDRTDANAVAEAKTPVMDKLMAEYPFVKGYASGLAVGLPDGQMGNSEVGHLNMGAGRIVYQELTRITILLFTCTAFCQTAAYTVITRICTAFLRWQSVTGLKKCMCTVFWTDVIRRRHPAKTISWN